MIPRRQTAPLLFCTSSDDKVRETGSILGIKVRKTGGKKEHVEIQSISLEEVIRDKAVKAYDDNKRRPVIVEHTGLFIKSLNGLPGAMTKVFLSALGNRRICGLIGNSRTAEAKTCVGFFNGHHVFYWTGTVKGTIATRPMGKSGFGWDSIFIPSGMRNKDGRTFAQMDVSEKHLLSMRRKALVKLRKSFATTKGMSLQELIDSTETESARFYMGMMRERNNNKTVFEPVHQTFDVSLFDNITKSRTVSVLEAAFNLSNESLLGQMRLFAVATPGIYSIIDRSNYLDSSMFIGPQFELSPGSIDRLQDHMRQLKRDAYSTYGDGILKVLRNYILQRIGIDKEDAFYINRSCNAKFYDEVFRMRTANGEALYYNPEDMISPITYLRNAFEKNKKDLETNTLFRRYVLPEVGSVWVYSNKNIKEFSQKHGGYLYVPVISLAEVAAFVVRQKEKEGAFDQFMAPYLKRYGRQDIRENWAYRAFDLFPTKQHEAELHMEIIKMVLKKHGQEPLADLLDGPTTFSDVCKAIMVYRDLLITESADHDGFLTSLRNRYPEEEICFTEIVVLDPGMKNRKYSIPRSPDADVVFLQGDTDYPFIRNKDINQLVVAHNICRSAIPAGTKIVTLLDHHRHPLVDFTSGRTTSDADIRRDSIVLEFFSLLMLADLDTGLKTKLIEFWNSLALADGGG